MGTMFISQFFPRFSCKTCSTSSSFLMSSFTSLLFLFIAVALVTSKTAFAGFFSASNTRSSNSMSSSSYTFVKFLIFDLTSVISPFKVCAKVSFLNAAPDDLFSCFAASYFMRATLTESKRLFSITMVSGFKPFESIWSFTTRRPSIEGIGLHIVF